MKLLKADSDHESLWIEVESEEMISVGVRSSFTLGKIILDDVVISQLEGANKYRIEYDDVSLEGYPKEYNSRAMFRAYQLTDEFEGVRVMPCNFIEELFAMAKEQTLHDDKLTVECKAMSQVLTIKYFENGVLQGTYSNGILNAYADYLCSGKIRAYYLQDVDGKRGQHFTKELEAFLEKTNDRLAQAIENTPLQFAYCYVTGEKFKIIAGTKNGHAVAAHAPQGVLNYVMENGYDVPFEIKTDEGSFSLGVDWSPVIPVGYGAALGCGDWDVIKLIGLVK